MVEANYSPTSDLETAQRCFGICAVADLTQFSRVGFRGANTAMVLAGHGYAVPERPNVATAQRNGELLARLGATEYLLLSDVQRGQFPEDGGSIGHQRDGDHFYRLERLDSHAWLMLSGARGAEMMAKLCGVDLRAASCPPGTVVQTSVARVNAIVIAQSLAGNDVFHLLIDRSYHRYMMEVLADAMREYGGEFIDPGQMLRS